MSEIVLITNLNGAFDEKLAEAFVREQYTVFAMSDKPLEGVTCLSSEPDEAAVVLLKKAGKLDFLLDTTDICDPNDNFSLCSGINVTVIERTYRQNVLRSMVVLEAFLPLMDEGAAKRLFYLTSAEASINETRCSDHFGYNMSKAALHQFIQMTRNKLTPKGYTFRVFDPMLKDVPAAASAESAYNYITRRRGTEQHDPLRDDEENLVFRDASGRQHTW